jgi:hypothetical protein
MRALGLVVLVAFVLVALMRRRLAEMQRARAELTRRKLARWQYDANCRLKARAAVHRLTCAVSGLGDAFLQMFRASETARDGFARFAHAWPAHWPDVPSSGARLGGHAVLPDFSTLRRRDGTLECDAIDSWSIDYGRRESRQHSPER